MGSDDAILALARCACGHGIGRHDDDGCPGAEATFCVCRLTPSAALDAAIERVRDRSRTRTFDVAKMSAELNSDDYERVGPVRRVDAAAMIAMLAPQFVRPQ